MDSDVATTTETVLGTMETSAVATVNGMEETSPQHHQLAPETKSESAGEVARVAAAAAVKEEQVEVTNTVKEAAAANNHTEMMVNTTAAAAATTTTTTTTTIVNDAAAAVDTTNTNTAPAADATSKPASERQAVAASLPDHHRLCHVIKRANFVGYGFHLHAEKGKAGQFIGKIDPDSPAEECGLRQGDRIIEVNSVRINHESHKEVVERIKAIEHEVKLLVLDPSQDPTGLALSKKDTAAMAAAPAVANGKPKAVTVSTSSSDNHSSLNSNSNNNNNKNNHSNGGTDTPDSMKKNGMDVARNGKTPPAAAATAAPATGGEAKTDDVLNSDLKLSVAEMRAKLANKKKVDPKRESVDLKKKYEIVQLL